MHQHRTGMYQKFRSVGQWIGVPAGKSGDAGGWESGAGAVGVPEMGIRATGPDDCLSLAMSDKLASIRRPYKRR